MPATEAGRRPPGSLIETDRATEVLFYRAFQSGSVPEKAGVEIVAGPVELQDGRARLGKSVYLRDPDQDLLEFIVYDG